MPFTVNNIYFMSYHEVVISGLWLLYDAFRDFLTFAFQDTHKVTE
jgi:hypothetical protein